MSTTVKKASFKDMTRAAIGTLKERNGSSIHAIAKYISQVYSVDMAKSKTYLKRYLKKAVSDGELIQTKGNGLSGSFKLAAEKPKQKPKSKRTKQDASEQVNGIDMEKKLKLKHSASKKSMGPKASAALKKVKDKKNKDPVTNGGNKKKPGEMNGSGDGRSDDKKKSKSAKPVANKNSKIVLKRASLIGGTKIKKPMKKTASKSKARQPKKETSMSNVKD